MMFRGARGKIVATAIINCWHYLVMAMYLVWYIFAFTLFPSWSLCHFVILVITFFVQCIRWVDCLSWVRGASSPITTIFLSIKRHARWKSVAISFSIFEIIKFFSAIGVFPFAIFLFDSLVTCWYENTKPGVML